MVLHKNSKLVLFPFSRLSATGGWMRGWEELMRMIRMGSKSYESA